MMLKKPTEQVLNFYSELDQLYFKHLNDISLLGRVYKRFIAYLLYYAVIRKYGSAIVEVGSGIGSGILGTYPSKVVGLDINAIAVNHCLKHGMNAKLIEANNSYPLNTGDYDVCILDNVLEHIEDPRTTLNECHRITRPHGALVIVVPGLKGYLADGDHKIYYDEHQLIKLDDRYVLEKSFALPSIFKCKKLSSSIKQYCLVAVYQKIT